MRSPAKPDATDQALTEGFFAQLRILFRQKSLRLIDVAERIGVSERTVKRYMQGQGVTLDILGRLCAVAGVSILDLSDLVKSMNHTAPDYVTPGQVEMLRNDQSALLVYTLLLLGLTPNHIARELRLNESQLIGTLAKLDRLQIIALYPGNRARILRWVAPMHERSPRVRAWIANSLTSMMENVDFEDPAALCDGTIVRLTPSTYARAYKRLSEVLREIEQTSSHDLNDLDPESNSHRWYSVYVAAFPQPEIEKLLKREKCSRNDTT